MKLPREGLSQGMTLPLPPDHTPAGWGQTYGVEPGRLNCALRLLRAVCRRGSSVADLGCLHGAYTLEFARAGYFPAGIDARQDNIDQCWRAADDAGLSNTAAFICDDVRNITRYGKFDAVFCCGLLYHMNQPVELLRQIAKVTRKLLIVQTHISLDGGTTNEGYEGHWYTEGPLGHPFSAWGNSRSFWLTRESLLDAMQDAGFGLVAQIHDHLEDVNGAGDRMMAAGIKDRT